jgi:hypothetical protein
MKDWEKLVRVLANGSFEKVKEKIATDGDVYANSLYKREESYFFLAKVNQEKRLIIVNQSKACDSFQGELKKSGQAVFKLCPLNHENAVALRATFSFTNPVPLGSNCASIGLGDRLGIASPGHIATVREKKVKPVLAQQSIRELTLTNRTFPEVLDDVSWAVFQEGYEGGFGADGDHLKSEAEVMTALAAGYTMLTLDCSDYIDNTVADLGEAELAAKYKTLASAKVAALEKEYLSQNIRLDSGRSISFTAGDFQKIVLTYLKMLEFTEHIYHDLVKQECREIDFEVSVDETATATTPQAHYLIANELTKAKVNFSSLAPKFCGEFQKGIDYIGDISQFTAEIKLHAEIADRFGYKLSLHSGSDKFSIFPAFGEYTKGRFHVKTSGTSWLEALRIIAAQEPRLFRDIWRYALEHFEAAQKYYHVTTDLNKIPPISEVADSEFVKLFAHNDFRQLLHITYGYILQAHKDGAALFKDQLYRIWKAHEQEYSQALQKHIGEHLKLLGL